MEDFTVMFKVSIDSTFTRIGFGVYQRKVFALLCLVGISFNIIDTGPVFWAHSPELHCSRGHNGKNLNLSARNDNLSHIQINGTISVNLTSNSTNSDELLTTISPENEVKFNGSNATFSNNSAASGMLDYEDIFVYHDIGHKCSISIDEGLLIVHSGSTRQHCHDPTPDYKISTISSRWSLVCQNKWWLVLLHHMYTMGQIIGCLLTGFFSDRFGRRVTLVVCTAVQVPISVLSAVVPNLVAFTILRTILAAATAGQFNTAFIQVIELLGPAWRVFGGTIFFCFLPLGNLILTGAAYYFRNYIALKLVTSIPLAFLLVYIWVLPESVRWMYSRGQSEDVRGHLKYITEINRIEGADDLADRQLDNNEKVQIPCDLATKPLMRKKIIVLSYIWWTCVVVLTTINYELLMRSTNRFIIVPAGAAFDILAYATSMLCLYKFGRRLPLTIALVVTGITLQCTAPAPLAALRDFHTTMVVIAKLFCTISMAILRIYAAELLPTALRGSGLGVITGVSYFGANVMPFMLKLNSVHDDLPHILEGGMCVMAALSVLSIPTTYKQALPDTVKEGEAMGANQHMLFFVVEERAGSITTKVVRPKSHSVAVTTPRVPTRPRFSLPDGKLRLTVPEGVNREKRRSWHTLLPEEFVKEGSCETTA